MNKETPVEWRISEGNVEYQQALDFMEQRVADIPAVRLETVWLLQHPPLYTAGTSAKREDLLDPDRFPVFETGRGGEYTYHGPGQRVGYVMMDLNKRSRDVRKFVSNLEEWIIRTLATFDITGERREGRVGIWVDREARDGLIGREDKIGAIGVRLRRWVSFHGISLNIDPDLNHYDGIVPCGISEHGVTSLHDLGVEVGIKEVDVALKSVFEEVFGRETVTVSAE